jgi:uncharacterized protein
LPEGPLRPARNGLHVVIRVSPQSKTDRLLAIADGQGGRVVKASVAAAAEGGRANRALLRLLAQAWDLPARDLSIIAGATNRNKVVFIAGDPQKLIEKITPQISILPGW